MFYQLVIIFQWFLLILPYQFFAYLPQNKTLYNLVPTNHRRSFRYLLIKGQSLILNNLIIEQQSRICPYNRLQRTPIRKKSQHIVFQHLSQIRMNLFMFLNCIHNLVQNISVHPYQLISYLIIQVFIWLDVDQQRS